MASRSHMLRNFTWARDFTAAQKSLKHVKPQKDDPVTNLTLSAPKYSGQQTSMAQNAVDSLEA